MAAKFQSYVRSFTLGFAYIISPTATPYAVTYMHIPYRLLPHHAYRTFTVHVHTVHADFRSPDDEKIVETFPKLVSFITSICPEMRSYSRSKLMCHYISFLFSRKLTVYTGNITEVQYAQ